LLLICLSVLLWSGETAWAGYEFPMWATSQSEITPDISGDLLVWAQMTPLSYRIWGQDLSTGLDSQISSLSVSSTSPDIEGGIVAWEGIDDSAPLEQGIDIYRTKLTTGEDFVVCVAAGDQYGPVASGDLVVWTDHRCRAEAPPDTDYTADVYGYDLLLGTEIPIAAVPGVTEWHPSISGNRLVYTDCGYPGQLRGLQLARDPESGRLTFEEFPIPQTLSWFRDCPMLSGDFLVWMDYWDGDFYHADIRAVDLRTGVPFPVSTAPGSAPQSMTEVGVDISGSIVVWEDWRNNPGRWNEPPYNCDIYGYDLSTGVEFPVCTVPGPQRRPRVSGNLVVWEDYRELRNQGDVYGYKLNVTATPTGTAVATTVIGTTLVFESVQEAGMTTVDVLTEPPAPSPTGFQFIGNCYSITTTAGTAGGITTKLHYREGAIPGGQEDGLSLFWWDGSKWRDITARPVDTTNNTVTGECTALSAFVLGLPIETFADVGPDCWAFLEIEACAMGNVVTGYEDGNYQPTWPVTRSAMAVYIARALVAPSGDAGLDSYAPPTTPSFPDVPVTDWAFRHVEYLRSQAIVTGYADGFYRPNLTVTRDQMAAYISRSICEPKGEAGLVGYTPPETPSFSDVGADHWAYRYIEYALASDVVYGYKDGLYRPNATVTRDQMAVYIARAFGLL
jgi:beta propeller repeat protein